jgi:hypothetical protein
MFNEELGRNFATPDDIDEADLDADDCKHRKAVYSQLPLAYSAWESLAVECIWSAQLCQCCRKSVINNLSAL